MPLINSDINYILTWPADYVFFFFATGVRKFAKTKLYVLVEILSTQDNAKLLEQLKQYKRQIHIWII